MRAIRLEIDHPTLRLALIHATDVQAAPSLGPLVEELAQAEGAVREDPIRCAGPVRQALHDVLRHGGYKRCSAR